MVVGAATFAGDQNQYRLVPVSICLSCAFTIMTALQLFNWFSKRYLGTVLGIWLSVTIFGMMTKFRALQIYKDFFPSMKLAE